MESSFQDIVSYILGLACPEAPGEILKMAFVFRLPPGASKEIAIHCSRLFETGTVESFGFVDSPAASGAEGADAFTKELIEAGVPPKAICPLPYIYPDDHINTYFEAHSFARWLREETVLRVLRVGVVAQPYHLPRGYLSLVSCLEREGFSAGSLDVYPLPAPIQSWAQPVVHSQGTTKGTKWQIVRGEADRVLRYGEKGDLISVSRGLEWLNSTISC
jgi:hypothetical protein